MNASFSPPHLATLILDFDSTFTKVEALDVLAEMLSASDPVRAADVAHIKTLTEQAMAGEISFSEALQQRIRLLRPTRDDIAALVEVLKTQVSASIVRNTAVFTENPGKIRIISGGFHDFIDPVVADYGIEAEYVLANRLIFDADGVAIGVDLSNPLSQDGGKITAVQTLDLPCGIVMVGDGWTDYEVYKGGAAERFYAFTENVSRAKVLSALNGDSTKAAASFDEVLHAEGYQGRYSFPRSKLKVLLLENIHPDAVRAFREEGYDVTTMKGALDEDDLIEAIQGVHILGLRSKTNLTAKAVEAADKLLL